MITDGLRVPTLLLDEAICKENIQRMVGRARRHQLRLRPHFKTHQSLDVGRWMRAEGIEAATVSSLSMAAFFAPEWDDITVAFPFNVHELATVNAVAKKVRLGLTVENEAALTVLDQGLETTVRIWMKVDAGYHRTGVPVEQLDQIQALLEKAAASEKMEAAGVLIHAGHSYDVRGDRAIGEVHRQTLKAVAKLRAALSGQFPDLEYSIGDTPCCSTMEDFEGCTEMRPGNFVFYDVTQHYIGSNKIRQVAVALACPVVALHPDRNEVVVYGGGVHLSKDATSNEAGEKVMGLPVSITESGWDEPWPGCRVSKLSQEHGIISVTPEVMATLSVGDWVGILPVHSCMTADLMGEYLTLGGQTIDHLNGPKFK